MSIDTILYIIAIICFTIAVIFGLSIVFGDDTEDKGISLTDKLLERVHEWNIQKAYNDTLLTAERFNCDYDESLCVLGKPDPDLEIEK